MDAQICHRLAKRLDISLSSVAVQESLDQSLSACEAGDEGLMIELAQIAKQMAWECRDHKGVAAASIHIGMAYAQMNQFDQAINACEQARRIYHRDPTRQQRLGEGIATYGLGLIFQHHSIWLYSDQAKAIGNLRARAVGYYQESLSLLEQAMQHYASVGDQRQFRNLREIHQDISQRIACQIPTVYVDGEKYRLVPVEAADHTFPDLQPDIDYRPVMIGGDFNHELGISPGDFVLIHVQGEALKHRPETHDEPWPLEVFQRDERGTIRFILAGDDETQVGYVAAILKPTD